MRWLRSLLLASLDLTRGGYTYHSGALTYHFMLSLAPLTVVFLNITALTGIVTPEKVETVARHFLPAYTDRVVEEVLSVYQRIGKASALALVLSYVFSVGLVKNLSRALSYVSEGLIGERKEPFYWVFMPMFYMAVMVVIYLEFVFTLYVKHTFGSTYLINLVHIFSGTLFLTLIYLSFLKKRVHPCILVGSSLVVSVVLVFVQLVFAVYLTHIFKGSLFYGTLGTLIAFLLWMNLVSLLLLFGARLIYRLTTL